MANKIQYTDLYAQRFVPPSSRYANLAVLQYSDLNILTFETYKRKTYQPQPGDQFTVITAGHEYRPDLLSNAVYGVSDFWWRIMEVNGIMDIYDFKAGRNIRLPDSIFF